jgi:hypothetical protein
MFPTTSLVTFLLASGRAMTLPARTPRHTDHHLRRSDYRSQVFSNRIVVALRAYFDWVNAADFFTFSH